MGEREDWGEAHFEVCVCVCEYLYVYACVFLHRNMGSTASKAHHKAPPHRRKKKRKVCVYVCLLL